MLYGNLWHVNEQKLHKINPKAIAGNQFNQKQLVKNLMEENKIEVDMHNVALLMNDLKITQTSNIANITRNITMSKDSPVLLTNISLETKEGIIHNDNVSNMILSWDKLDATVKVCNKCNLCYGRKNTVFERGNRNAKWMFIGDSPGEQEDAIGTPFVGYIGELLDKMIVAMQLDPQNDVYICNVVKCKPTYNRNLEINEMDACRNYLLSQIELVKPQIIVALGRAVSLSLLGTDLATAKLRGKEYQFNNIPVIVTYHPSYLLRNPDAKKDTWQDLQFALRTHANTTT